MKSDSIEKLIYGSGSQGGSAFLSLVRLSRGDLRLDETESETTLNSNKILLILLEKKTYGNKNRGKRYGTF